MKYNMVRHIHETPEALRRTLAKARPAIIQLANLCRRRSWDRILLTGCGASYHDAVGARPAFEQLLGLPTAAWPASELGLCPPEFFGKKHLLIAISRSGEKSDIMAAVRAAKRSDAFVVAITATPDSLLAEASDAVILTHEGPEYCQPKTKSFVSVLGVLILLAIHLMPPGAKRRQKELLRGLRQMPKRIERTIRECRGAVRKAAVAMRSCRHAYVTGMQSNLGAVLEAALKLKETSFVHAEAFATGEVAQGPLLLPRRNWAYITMISAAGRELSLRMMRAARRKGATVIAICSDPEGVGEIAPLVAPIAALPDELFAPMAYIVPVQMLAHELAVDKGLNPDDPAGFDMILDLILEPGRAEPEMRQG